MEGVGTKVHETVQGCYFVNDLMNKAIFLDRDGTLIEEVGYLKRIEDIRIFPNTKSALEKFKSLGFLNIVVTNQSGIARGYLTPEVLDSIHLEIRKELRKDSVDLIDDLFYSPYHREGVIREFSIDSEDRKPGTGMISKAESKHNIAIEESFFIGDSFTDMKCAENAGMKRILLKTGYGINDYRKCIDEKINIDYYAGDLFDASLYIESILKNK